MSLEMTVDTRAADSFAAADGVAAPIAAPVTRFWLQDLAMVAGTTFGVLLASSLSVLLFLR